MVGVFPFSALSFRMDNLGKALTKGVTRLAQDVAKGIGATVVDTTPVDTGAARSNWRATLSAPASGTIPPYSPGNHLGISESANAGAAKAQQTQVIDRFKAAQNASIFITNNIPYIGSLNDGRSPQSPGGMVALGFQTGRSVVQRFSLEVDIK